MDFSNGIALVQSKTFWGALFALIAIVAQQFGWTSILAWAADPRTIDWLLNWVAAAGSVWAIFGRFVASRPVTSILPSK